MNVILLRVSKLLHSTVQSHWYYEMSNISRKYNHVVLSFPDSVKESGGRVLVHCQAGISRSATICLAYLIHAQRVRLNEAFDFVKRRRQVISPNLAFMGQLQQFETDVLRPYTVLDTDNGTTAIQYLCSENTDLSWSRLSDCWDSFLLCSLMIFGPQTFHHPVHHTHSFTYRVLCNPHDEPNTMCMHLIYTLKCTKRTTCTRLCTILSSVFIIQKQENSPESIGSLCIHKGPSN